MSETFVSLIDKGASATDIAAHLDGLDEGERVGQVRACGGSQQKKLWDLIEGHGKVDVSGFVPDSEQTVIYAGRNSLPVFNFFQKRFWRPADGGPIVGFNYQSMSKFTGPGYFHTKDWEKGEILFDYTELPTLRPPGWPAIKPNKGLIAGPVYGGMKDYCRRVSEKTVLGIATKMDKPMGQFFLLTHATRDPD